MPAGYVPLPTQQPNWEADRELDEAFDSDGEEEQSNSETTPLSHSSPAVPAAEASKVGPEVTGAYDFE